MNKTITKSQYYTLIGLRELAKKQLLIIESLHPIANEITKEDDNMGHTYDFIWGNRDLDEMLKILDIKVK